ncbi:hypothetical protein ACS0TY_017438 [Phlomoides rotata]
MHSRSGDDTERAPAARIHEIWNEAPRKENKSYLQALKSSSGDGTRGGQKISLEDKIPGFVYKSSNEDRSFLKLCFTGQLKEEFPWLDVAEEIQEFGEGRFQIKYRGGGLVFIHPTDDQPIECKDLESISKWFKYLE